MIEKATLVVKPAVARRQIEETKPTPPPPPPGGGSTGPTPGKGPDAGAGLIPPPPPMPPDLFIGSVPLDGNRIGRDAGRIAEEVIQHLSTLPGAEVEVSLEIRVRVPGGIKSDVIRTVTENANTLKFSAHSFEYE